MLSATQALDSNEVCMWDEEAREERVRSHSTRSALLNLLAEKERKLTAKEIRAELPGEPDLRSVYYHLRVLEASDLIARDGDRYKLR
jgi:Fe2+ or Zn2+ uptake regulation protein